MIALTLKSGHKCFRETACYKLYVNGIKGGGWYPHLHLRITAEVALEARSFSIASIVVDMCLQYSYITYIGFAKVFNTPKVVRRPLK